MIRKFANIITRNKQNNIDIIIADRINTQLDMSCPENTVFEIAQKLGLKVFLVDFSAEQAELEERFEEETNR